MLNVFHVGGYVNTAVFLLLLWLYEFMIFFFTFLVILLLSFRVAELLS